MATSSSLCSSSCSSYDQSYADTSLTQNNSNSARSPLGLLKHFNRDEETDEMYNSLRRLSNSTAMSTTRLRKISPSPIPYKDQKKLLTFTLNEIYYTNGKPNPNNDKISEVQEIIGSKKHLYKKEIKSIGTSLKNCDISDMISIDIDPESTRLPLMCKLMIIVEGAAFERGQRVLVRDASVQVDNEFDNNSSNDTPKTIPIITVNDQNRTHPPIINRYERHEVIKTHHTGRYRSTENINHESYNNNRQNKQNFILNRSASGGSLSNLSSTPLSIYTQEEGSNYFNRKKGSHHYHHHRDIMLEPNYLDIHEHASAPYYQYQRKNLVKKDFSSNTIITNESYHYVNKITRTINNPENESVEVHIPINLAESPRNYRNEKRLIVSRDISNDYDYDSSFRSITDNMRRYIDERLNRFEAEVTFFNLSPPESLINHHHHHQAANVVAYKHTNHPVSYTYHYQKTNKTTRGAGANIVTTKSTEPSVTNMMLMQIVNGRLIE